ncbi:MAG: hypothetical protein R3E42_13590 [Burkholderiaceae bacterium]
MLLPAANRYSGLQGELLALQQSLVEDAVRFRERPLCARRRCSGPWPAWRL